MTKIGAVYTKNKNNEYEYDRVTSTDEIKDCNIIEIKEDTLANLRIGEDVELVDFSKSSSNIVFVFSDSVLDGLYRVCNERNYTEKEKSTYLYKLMTSIFERYKNVKIEKRGGLMAVDLSLNNKNETKEIKEPGESITNKYDNINMKEAKSANEIIAEIKKKVIAQDKAVKDIIYTIYSNQTRIDSGQSKTDNILVDGPTGTGKTFIVESAAELLNLPLVVVNSSSFASAGYDGARLDTMLVSLLKKTNGNIEAAQRGIIILDEVDKLALNSDELKMKKAVQQELLPYLSGIKCVVEYEGKKYEFDTSKITFICIGAFTDLREKKIETELTPDGKYSILRKDYIDAGFERELVGRLPIITSTDSLGKEDLIRIMKESSTSVIKNLIANCKIEGNGDNVIFSDDILEKIAERAMKEDTGARALDSIVGAIKLVINERLYNGVQEDIVIDDEILKEADQVYVRTVKNIPQDKVDDLDDSIKSEGRTIKFPSQLESEAPSLGAMAA